MNGLYVTDDVRIVLQTKQTGDSQSTISSYLFIFTYLVSVQTVKG